MSWLSSLWSPRKRPASDDTDDGPGLLGSVFKRMKPDSPAQISSENPQLVAQDTLAYSVQEEGDLGSLISSVLVPRPLVLVAWKNQQGDLSIVPTSFCSLVSENPAYISIGLDKESLPEDSSFQAIASREEFTVSIVSEWLAKSAARTAGTYELPSDEADLKTGLTTTGSNEVSVPRISEAAASLECIAYQKVDIKDSDDKVASIVVVAEIVCMHVNKAVLKNPDGGDSVVDVNKLKPVAAVGVDESAPIGKPFSLPLAISPPVSPKSPEVREAQAPVTPNKEELAEEVAHAVVEALNANSQIADNENLEELNEELEETVRNAVEDVLEVELDVVDE